MPFNLIILTVDLLGTNTILCIVVYIGTMRSRIDSRDGDIVPQIRTYICNTYISIYIHSTYTNII